MAVGLAWWPLTPATDPRHTPLVRPVPALPGAAYCSFGRGLGVAVRAPGGVFRVGSCSGMMGAAALRAGVPGGQPIAIPVHPRPES